MATDVKLPELGENITSATVLDVLVKEGDTVAKDQAILSLESDKAEFDLPSPAAGKVTEVLVKKGDEVEVGQAILRLDDSGAKIAGAAASGRGAQQQPDAVREAEEAQRDADTQEASEDDGSGGHAKPARAASRSREPAPSTQRRTAGSEPARQPKPDHESSRRSEAGPAREPERKRAREDKHEHEPDERSEKDRRDDGAGDARPSVAAAPSVRRLARALGVDVTAVSGTQGRVSAEDVYRHVREKLAGLEGGGGRAKSDGGRDYSRWGEIRVEKMSTVRRRTAEQMSLAWSSIPHVTHHDAADISELDRLRRQFAPRVERAGGKLTITAVLLKVVGSALRRYPKFNASVDMENAEIIYKQFVNVGVAVDTERGLLVPVLRSVDEKNIVELALELHEVSEAARTRKIRPDLLQGATFTVTNLGGVGGIHFSPLINPPEVAVLGVSRASTKPVWADGKFEPRLMLPLSVTYDHRIIDGADAARFLRWVCEALEEPFLMDLEGD